MPVNFRKLAMLAGEIRLAAADAIGHTLRVTSSTASKTAGKVSLTNSRSEFIESIPMQVTNGTDNGTESVSIRTTISGSTQNADLTAAAYSQHVVNVQKAITDGALKGFLADVTYVAKP